MDKKSIFKIISILLTLSIIVACVLYLFFRTDGFQSGLNSFYLKCDEDTFMSEKENYDILLNNEYKFEIVSEKDKLFNKNGKYYVNVIPNDIETTAFSFKVDGENVKFDDVKSLSKGFIIKTYDNYFTIKALEDLPDILKSIYPGKEISDCPSSLNSEIPYFKLVVSNENESISVNFNLKHNVVIVNLVDDSDEAVGKNHIRFSANQFVLTSENQIATFDVEIDDGYFYEFENTDSDILRVKKENNTFTLTLKIDTPIKRETNVDIKFVAKVPSITFTPKSVSGKVGLITYPANKLTFSTTELVLTNSIRTATFDCILADDYGIQDYYKGFDGVFEISLWGNRCTVTLAEDYQLKSCTNEEIMFTVIRSAKKVDLNIGCINASGIVGNHISFTDIKNLVALDNENRQCTFSFQVDAGYKIEKIEYDATIMNLELSDGQCTVKLIDGYIPVSVVESHIIFNIDFDESITLTINLSDETPDMYGKGHIRFPFENICLTNKNRTISFNVEIDNGYAFTYQSNGNGIFKISTNEDGLLTVSLVENYVLTTNSTGKISFMINIPSLILSPVDHRDEGHITFSVKDVILTNTQRSATFDFTIEEGYILDDYSFLSDGLFTMTVNGNTCTVTLLDGVNLTEIGQYNLLFTVGAYE